MAREFDQFHKTFSGADMVASIVFPGTNAITVGELTTFSYSVYREKAPVRTCSYINVRGFTKGPRTVAGTMIWTVFNKHIVNRLRAEVPYFASLVKMKADEWPPFDIYITMANEYGASARINIYGLTVVDEGQVMSIEDLFTENQWSFMARNIDLLDELGAEQNAPITTMNHKEAVPTFNADTLLLDDDLVAMNKELQKMKDEAKAAVDVARAKAKEAFTAEAAKFAMAQVPTDKFDGWTMDSDAFDVPDYIHPDENDYSSITDITVDIMNDTDLNYTIWNGDNRTVYVEAYGKGTDGHRWALPKTVSIWVGLEDQNGQALKTQDNGGGDKAPKIQWKGISFDNDSTKVTYAGHRGVRFNIIGLKKCPIPPKIFVKISIEGSSDASAVLNADDGSSTEFTLQGDQVRYTENNGASTGENAITYVFLTNGEKNAEKALQGATIKSHLYTGYGIYEEKGDELDIALFYDDVSWASQISTWAFDSFSITTSVAGWDQMFYDNKKLNPYIDFGIDAGDSLDTSDWYDCVIKAPITLYVHTTDLGDFGIGGNKFNGNFTDQDFVEAGLTSMFNDPFEIRMKDAAKATCLTDKVDYITNTIFFKNGIESTFSAVRKLLKKHGDQNKFTPSMMYLVVGPFTAETASGGTMDVDFEIKSLRVNIHGLHEYQAAVQNG